MRRTLGLFIVLAATAAFAVEPRDFIPTGSVTARVMRLAAPPRADELAAKMQEAAANDREWWLEHVKNAPRGEPLPYDSRMGLTQDEYTEFLELGDALTLQEVGTGTLIFERPSKDVVVLSGQNIPADLVGIRIDLSTDSVITGYGILSTRAEVHNLSTDSPTGPWHGVQWKLESVDSDLSSGVVAKLALGRLTQSGEGILYFDAKEVSKGSLSRRASAILLYDQD